MKNLYYLIKREFTLFYQNKVLLVLFLGAPIMYGVLVGSVYKKGKVTDLPIIVVDEDRSPLSQQLIDMFNENEVIYVSDVLPDLANSAELAMKREATVVVHIPRNFAAEVNYNRPTEMTLFVNASNTLTSNYAMMAVNVCASTMKAGIQIKAQEKKGVPSYVAAQQYEPFKMTIVKQNIRSGNYLYFMLPGVLLTVLQQVMMLGLALSFASEFERGTFGELVSKSSNVFVLILAKIAPYLMMSVFIYLLYYGFSIFYQMPITIEGLGFFGASVLFLMAVCFIGIMVSVIIPNMLKATEILMVFASTSYILSVFTCPLSQMPDRVISLANFIPLTHILQVFRVLVIEGGTLDFVSSQLWGMAIIAIVSFVVSVIILQIKIRKTKKEAKVLA